MNGTRVVVATPTGASRVAAQRHLAALGIAVATLLGAAAGGALWVVLGLLLGGLWFFAAPILTAPVYALLLLVRSGMDSWAEVATISVGGFTVNLLGLVNVFLMATMLTYAIARIVRRRGFFWSATLAWGTIFCAYLLLTVLWSPYPEQSLREAVRMVALIAAFALAADLVRREPKWARRFVNVMLLASVVPSSVALFQFVTGTGLHVMTDVDRAYGTFWHPSGLGVFSMSINLLAFALAGEAWRQRRAAFLAYAAVFVLTAFIAFLTFTRAVWIALPIGWLVSAWYTGHTIRGRLARMIMLLGIGACASLPVWSIVFSRFANEIGNISDWTVDTNANPLLLQPLQVRLYMWRIALDLFHSSPWVGHGWGIFPLHLTSTTPLPPGMNPHNDYVKLLAEGGVIAFGLFGVLVFSMARAFAANIRSSSSLTRRLNIAAMAALAAYLVAAITDNLFGYTGPALYFWTLAGIAQGAACRRAGTAAARGGP